MLEKKNLDFTTSTCWWQKQALWVDGTLTVAVAPKDHITEIQLPAEAIYWTESKTCVKY